MEPRIRDIINDSMLREGRHIHSNANAADEKCLGGDPECPFWQVQLEDALEAWGGS